MDTSGASGVHTRNDLHTDAIHGTVVQAGTIDHVYLSSEPEPAPPSQLPPVSGFFTGRQRELQVLARLSAASGEDPMVAVITGPGGVGKTTLALRWLHDQRSRFGDGQLYADMGALSSNGPRGPEHVLEWFLIALGLSPERVPLGLAERASLYRSLTADRMIAVLLDNALSVAQVRPLLPTSSDSVVLVTSRWRLAGLRIGGARFLSVEPFDITDSVALLGRIVGDDRIVDERDDAAELARLCGGMPIALAVAGARLTARPNRPVGREVGLLRQANPLAVLVVDGETSVQAVFDMSYHDLRPPEALIYRTSALHPGRSFGVGVIAAAVEQPVEDVEETLDALATRNLLTENGDRRFRFHDLLLVHARALAERESLDACASVVRRMVEWYLDMLVRVDLTLRPTRRRIGPRYQHRPDDLFDSLRTALAWAEHERDNITRAIETAAEQGWDDIAWQFCEALWGFVVHTRHYDMWLATHRIGLTAACRCGDRSAEARMRTQLAAVLVALRSYAEARELCDVALTIAQHAGDQFGSADTLMELAGIAQGQGDLPGALTYLHKVRAIREVIGTDRSLAVCHRRIGELLCELDRVDEGIEELTHAVAALADLGDKRQHERALTCLGAAYTRSGRLTHAQQTLTEALDLARLLGMRHDEAVILDAMGDAAERAGDRAAAHEHWSAAESIFAATDDPMTAVVTGKLARGREE